MSIKALIEEIVNNRWLIFALRVALGGIFIAASVTKLSHQAEFINIVTSYGILPDSLARFYALIVPWAELLIGCSLVLGLFTRFAAALSIPLIVSFIIASVYSLFQPVVGGCGCFGALITLSHPVSLAIDAVMLLIAVQLLLHKHEAEFLSIGPLLSRLNLGLGRRRFIFEKGSKFAVVAIAVLVIGMPLIAGAQSSSDTNPDNSIDSMIDSALASGKPAFLVFYEECLPCQVNQIRGLARDYGDRIVFINISSEDRQAVAQFEVEEFPTMFLITGEDDEGEYGGYTVAYHRSGSVNETELREIFDQVLAESTGGEQNSNGSGTDDITEPDDEGAQSSIALMIDDALNSGKPAFLVFYWGCLPCQAGTKIDRLERDYGDRIVFIRVNITQEDNPQAVKDEFDVNESPTMLLITGKDEGGYTVAYQRSGSVNETELRAAFDQALAESIGSD